MIGNLLDEKFNQCIPEDSRHFCQNTEPQTFDINGKSVTYLKCTDECLKYKYNGCVDYCPWSTYL